MAGRTFDELCQTIAEASSPEDVFASMRLAGRVGWENALQDEHQGLRALLDPEQFADAGARQGAAIMRDRLDQLHREALGEGEGVVEQGLAGDAPRFVIRTEQGAFEGYGVLARGDVATLYEGRAPGGSGTGRPVVLKIADDVADNDLMLDEVAALERLASGGGAQRKHFPSVLGSFRMPDGRLGAAIERLDAVDLLTVRERYRQGVPLHHVVWILRRLLSALGYAHQLGVLHGNIEPSHVMVRPRDHNVFLVDWCYALVEPAKTGRGFKCETPGYSAPEVGQRRPPLPSSDLFSAGQCALFLLGGDPVTGEAPAGLDPRFARILRHLTRPSPLQRAQDAWELFDEVGKARRAIFGQHTFQEFKI
ncbi:MAG: hypothetical protein MUF64_21190 [Polyangiaceae bacterium]|jgi:serine/threonine protein kinase|nr:hypothetical protein [Polyangiaceae bacterium]